MLVKQMSASRRSLLKFMGLAGGAVALGAPSFAASAFSINRSKVNGLGIVGDGPFRLPDLPYAYTALEPHIDAKTMEIHHSKHHAAYVNNLNAALEKEPDWQEKPLETLLKDIKKIPESIRTAVRNNGGGHYNHTFFWMVISPDKQEASGKLADAIQRDFGSLDDLKKQFNEAATKVFGSGWAWVVKDNAGKLSITSTPNQDNPIMDVAEKQGTPVLGVDVWEHAYYLKHQNKRAEYLSDFWNVVNWKKAGEFYDA
ncbi:MAG TPA: Fe-Mn family superoxide dismutase [Chitinophagales bacterium]|nr:Fe-Mn family superoxide dismutase [Chitinophagales bacterium]